MIQVLFDSQGASNLSVSSKKNNVRAYETINNLKPLKFKKMKKIIFATTVLVYCLLTAITTNAQETINVPQPVLESFNSHFKSADFKRWVMIKESYVATFKQDEKWRDAYFTKEGEYKGIGKYITADALPISVQQTLTNNYPGFEVSELYQWECTDNGLSYFAVLKNDKHAITLQLSPYGEVSFSQRTKIKEAKIAPATVAKD